MTAFDPALCRTGDAAPPHPVRDTLSLLLLRVAEGAQRRSDASTTCWTRQESLACDAMQDGSLQLWQNAG
jgi:hypothetical protein